MQQSEQGIWLVYDGDCPLCSAAARALKIREAAGALYLVNARENHPIIQEINDAGLDLDQGMVVKMNNVFYHGADAQNILALISTNSDWFNRLNAVLFRSKASARLAYPLFRFCRNLLLRVRGKSNINNLGKHQ